MADRLGAEVPPDGMHREMAACSGVPAGGVEGGGRLGLVGQGATEVFGGKDFDVGTEGQEWLGTEVRAEAQLDPRPARLVFQLRRGAGAKDFRGMEYLTVKDGKITHAVSAFDRSPMIKAGATDQG
jgi:hypothetical protein